MTNNDAEQIAVLRKQVANLEGWNKEMYENHRVELARLHNQITELHSIHRIKTDQLGDDNEELENRIKSGEDWDKKQKKLTTLSFDALEAMTTLSNELAVRNKKLEQVYLAGLRMRKTPVVDDDFPKIMNEFDLALDVAEIDE